MQAYELLCLDMPAEQAALAAAAPPGLLDAARARWVDIALEASSSSLAFTFLQHSHGFCLPLAAGTYVHVVQSN